MNFLEASWIEWHQLWRYDYLGMMMAIFWSQELVNCLPKLLPQARAGTSWGNFFLALDFAVEYPAFFIYCPSNKMTPRIDAVSSAIPTFNNICCQIVVLLIVEHICRISFPNFTPLEENHHSAAEELSVEFVMPRATLLLGIPLLDNISPGIIPLGKLHFISIVGWLMVRRFVDMKWTRRFKLV